MEGEGIQNAYQDYYKSGSNVFLPGEEKNVYPFEQKNRQPLGISWKGIRQLLLTAVSRLS